MFALDYPTYGRLSPRPEYYDRKELELPAWAEKWTEQRVLFTYEGVVWKIVLSGSHNNTPKRLEFVHYVRAVPFDEPTEKLATEGSSITDFASSLKRVQNQGRVFTPDVLKDCIPFELTLVLP